MILEVRRNLHRLARFKYLWFKNISEEWIDLVQFFGGYKSIIVPKIIYCNLSREGCSKCNSDGASKGNACPSTDGFCIKN